MDFRTVGESGLRVSRLGLGTITWGRETDMRSAFDTLACFTDAGGCLIDTAPAYGSGAAETFLGRFLAQRPRDSLVLMSKAGFDVHQGQPSVDTSRSALLSALRDSLKRLRTDYIDIWQLHAWGGAPLEESLATMDYAVDAGMVRYAGISNYVGWQTAQAVTWQKAMPGRTPIVSTQVEYSLLARRAEVEVVPALRHYGLGFFPWSPLGRGVLTGKYRRGAPRGSRGASEHFGWFVKPYLEARSASVVEAVTRAAEGLGYGPEQVALMWVRDAPGVTAPLLGARTPDQLLPYLACEDRELPRPIVDALDDVSGGPHQGRAPRIAN